MQTRPSVSQTHESEGISNFTLTRPFVLLWVANATSSLGDHVYETTLVLWIVTRLANGEPWEALAISGVYLASAIPSLIFGPFAGVYVDRHEPRRTSMLASSFSALTIAALAILSIDSLREFMHLDRNLLLISVYASSALAAILVQVMKPASTVLIRDVLPSSHFVQASSYTNVTSSVVMLAGPAIASVIFFQFGPAVGLAINALSVAGSFLFVSLLPKVNSKQSVVSGTNVVTDLRAGLVHFRNSRPLVALAVGLGFMVIAGGIVNSLSIFFLTENLNASENLFGLFASFQAAGMLGGAVLGVFLAARLDIRRLFWIAIVGIGAMIVAFSRQTSYVPGVVCITLIGVFVSLIPLALGPIMMQSTPRELLGRVSSVMTLILGLATVSGLGLGGLLYGSIFHDARFEILSIQFNPLSIIIGLAGLVCVVSGLWVRSYLGSSTVLEQLEG